MLLISFSQQTPRCEQVPILLCVDALEREFVTGFELVG